MKTSRESTHRRDGFGGPRLPIARVFFAALVVLVPVATANSCWAASCGDGVLDPGEECDDGNAAPLDGCGSDCVLEGCCRDGTRIQFFRIEFEHPSIHAAESIAVSVGKFCGHPDRRSDVERFERGDVLPVNEHSPVPSSGTPFPSDLVLEHIHGNVLTFVLHNTFKVEQNVAMQVTINGTETFSGCIHASCSLTLPEERVYDTWFRLVDLDGINLWEYCAGHCGDGVLDPGEECDDGDIDENDGCLFECVGNICGDGLLDSGAEECDDGNVVSGDGCDTSCRLENCGNGIRDPGEACDDGNVVPGDGCNADCTSDETCGSGFRDPWEACDDGVFNSDTAPDACRTDCTTPRCGDGVADSGEQCDDGNPIETDGCHGDCTLGACGDGVVDPGEECDAGAANSDTTPDACRTTCTAPTCGDSVVDTGEQCDDGNLVGGDGCRSDCVLETCGNGVIDPGEVCDDGNRVDGDLCSSDCRIVTFCGNGVLESGEECDDGNGDNSDACLVDCEAARCGDGFVQAGVEPCDDGNFRDEDACLRGCILNVCGDGILNTGFEQCDDGNLEAGDGCRADCDLEICGDGVPDIGEECDDGNGIGSDACTADCRIARCGDGVLWIGTEECDDGNLDAGDGCDPSCLLEVTPDEADLRIAKSDSPDTVEQGALLGYTLSITNGGPGTALDVVVTDTLSSDVHFVGSTGPCHETSPQVVTCAIGALLADSTVRYELAVRVDSAAPTAGTRQHGECDGTEDLCNRVLATSATPDPSSGNNGDSEPTDVVPSSTGGAVCGNGVVEPGESCEPPDIEDCSNLFDDDFDGLTDCDDPDCLTGRPSCALDCQVVPACEPIRRDPAMLRFGRNGSPDSFKIHARFAPTTPIDLFTEDIGFALANMDGTFYRGRLLPGDLAANASGTRWCYLDGGAADGRGLRSGLSVVKVKARIFSGTLTYAFRFAGFADLSAARHAEMTTTVTYGPDVASLSAMWAGSYGKSWKLRMMYLK